MNEKKNMNIENKQEMTDNESVISRIRYTTKHPSEEYSAEKSFQKLLERIHQPVEEKHQRVRWWRYAAVAASLALALTLGYHAIRNQQKTKAAVEHLLAAVDQRQKFVLPDGSTAWLNVGSELIYYDDFGLTTREAHLVGEAYFEIVADADHPFVIKADQSSVQVLGTKFNLRAYADDGKIITTLLEGSVRFNKKQSDAQGVIISPGQQLVFDADLDNIVINEVNCTQYIAWKDGKLMFRQCSVCDAFANMERSFGVKIVIMGNMLEDKRKITGTFCLDDSLESILMVMQESLSFDYEVRNDTVFIK